MRLLIEAANTTIAVDHGQIVEPTGTFEKVVRAPHGEVLPGLINAHDHLHRNHYGRLGAPPYANAYAWANDIQQRFRTEIARGRTMNRRHALLHGAWKNLLAGVTHVVHHDAWEADFEGDFPMHVVRIKSADSLGMTEELPLAVDEPFALHVAEGVDPAAADEVRELHARGLLTPRLLAVHLVGADGDGIARLQRGGCAVGWCPSSNRYLFGRTAPEMLLAGPNDLLLGTDSLLTGDGTMLDELRVARQYAPDHLLLDAIGRTAATWLGLTGYGMHVGARADLVVSKRPLLDANLDDILLVMADGALRVLAPELVDLMKPAGGQIVERFGVTRWISAS
jgi:cytosine/adenosine deaminase-related metal-dependent hydrolase